MRRFLITIALSFLAPQIASAEPADYTPADASKPYDYTPADATKSNDFKPADATKPNDFKPADSQNFTPGDADEPYDYTPGTSDYKPGNPAKQKPENPAAVFYISTVRPVLPATWIPDYGHSEQMHWVYLW